MKKIILFLGIFFMSVRPALAYYGDYGYSSRSDSSPFTIILAIIVFVFGILQIILFFKVWGMTNDVKQMKDKFVTPVKSNNATITYFGIKAIKGEEAAKKYIVEEIIKEFSSCETTAFQKREVYEKKLGDINKKYKHLLKDAKVEFPRMDEYLDLVSPNEYGGFKIGEKAKLEDNNQEYIIKGFNPLTGKVRVVNPYDVDIDFNVSDLKKIDVPEKSKD